jgi:glycine/sarcosine N-methyltransferase
VSDPHGFYEDLAADYHLMFQDWWASATWQGEVLTDLLHRAGVDPPASVYDCTCGIGTQALPLAAHGFRVTGSDLSAAAVERARAEAQARGIDVRLDVADIRDLPPGRYDAVVSFDNSLPHLLTDADLAAAVRSIRGCLDTGGPFLASIRDYDAILRDGTAGVLPVVHGSGDARRIVGQAWEWAGDRRTVRINVFILRPDSPDSPDSLDSSAGWHAAVRSATYRALRRAELTAALEAGGFGEVRWLSPEESGYYQPVVIARAR